MVTKPSLRKGTGFLGNRWERENAFYSIHFLYLKFMLFHIYNNQVRSFTNGFKILGKDSNLNCKLGWSNRL